jgi:hypothetical protein
MISDIATYTELLINFSCQHSNFDNVELKDADFTSEELIIVNDFIDFQKANICTFNEVYEEMYVSINAVYTPILANCYYNYSEMTTEQKAILDSFNTLLHSKVPV